MTRWIRGYAGMLRWEVVTQRRTFPARFCAQVLIGAGFAVGIGFLRDLSNHDALYLTSGAAVVAVVVHGLMTVSVDEFVSALPVARGAATAARLTVTVLTGLAGAAAAVAVTAWRYGVVVDVSWQAVAAMGWCATVAAMAGLTLARAAGGQMLGRTVAQVLILVVIGFTPINFAGGHLPLWLDRLHDWLLFEPMAIVLRTQMFAEPAGGAGRAYLTLAIWFAGLAGIAGVLARRRR